MENSTKTLEVLKKTLASYEQDLKLFLASEENKKVSGEIKRIDLEAKISILKEEISFREEQSKN